jgi:hypothetical protein
MTITPSECAEKIASTEMISPSESAAERDFGRPTVRGAGLALAFLEWECEGRRRVSGSAMRALE